MYVGYENSGDLFLLESMAGVLQVLFPYIQGLL